MMRLATLCIALSSLCVPTFAQNEGGLMGSQDITPKHACQSPAEVLQMHREVTRYGRQVGFLPGPLAAPKYRFYPQAGNPNGDLTCTNYVDLNASAGQILDWRCAGYTYDGHDASDSIIRSFAEQDIGLPVFAALDGRVITVVDGYFDRNIAWAGAGPANRVAIDHGGGLVTHYLHFRKNSILVKTNQNVVAGQQLALTGSSGRSNWPHLHFATKQSGKTVEPFTGNCNTGTSMWQNQPNFGHSLRVYNIGITRINPASVKAMPERLPGGGWVKTSDTYVYIWVQLCALPWKTPYRFRFKRPNGTVAYTSPILVSSNPALWSLSWWWWRWNITDMHKITGRWTIEFESSGKIYATAPVQVTSGTAPQNRAPNPVTVKLDPATPGASDAIFCRVTRPIIADDDYDVPRYRYRWLVTGKVVRDITHAGEADAIPRTAALGGDLVECFVTASDGKANGTTVRASALVTPSPWKDLGFAKAGKFGKPVHKAYGSLTGGHPVQMLLSNAQINAPMFWVASTQRVDTAIFGGTLVPSTMFLIPATTSSTGTALLGLTWPPGTKANIPVYVQPWLQDKTVSWWFAAGNAIQGTSQ